MAIEEAKLAALAAELGGAARPNVAALREALGASVSVVDADDMRGETPYRTFGAYTVYLIDGRNHCPEITTEPTSATGIVLAKRA
ncbi:MAG: hypothetical protein HY749_19210 [Gammaproteobacteria bacterium]|nr:hypothetical protein [Gammaproteobacteria bacterium]